MVKIDKEYFSLGKVLLGLVVISFLFIVFASTSIDNQPNENRYIESYNGLDMEVSDFSSSYLDGEIAEEKGSNSGLGFSFLGIDELKVTKIRNFKKIGQGDIIYLKVADFPLRTIAPECPSGSAVRFIEVQNRDGTGWQKDLFTDLWYKESSAEVLDLNEFSFLQDSDFYWGYVCYEYNDGSQEYSTKTAYWNGKCYLYPDVKSLSGVIDFDTEVLCQEYKSKLEEENTITTPDKTGGVGVWGEFSQIVKYPREVTQGQSAQVSGQFKVLRDMSTLYIETNIDPKHKVGDVQAYSVIDITADKSGCDGSQFYSGEFVRNVKAGDVVNFNFNVFTPQEVGDYKVEVFAKEGCWKDVGSSVNDVSQTQVITVTKDTSRDGSSNDWDSDGYSNDNDNCPVHSNIGQEDIDKDGVGDACDVCPTNKGLSDYFGCHPCMDLPSNSQCWDLVEEQYKDFDITDINEQWGDADLMYKAWLEEKETQAKKKLEQSCLIEGADCEVQPSSCTGNEATSLICPNGEEIVSEMCINGEMTKYQDCEGNTLIDRYDTKSFLEKYSIPVIGGGIVLATAVAVIFLI